MTPAALLSALRTAGVALVPIGEGTLRAQGERAVVDSWLPEIRQHKAELLHLLAVRHRRWLVTLPDGVALEADVLPPGNLPEVLAAYPPGTLAEPLLEGQEQIAETPPPAVPRLVRCSDCTRFERLPWHPRLGHCLAGEPESPCGLWDTDLRLCATISHDPPPRRRPPPGARKKIPPEPNQRGPRT